MDIDVDGERRVPSRSVAAQRDGAPIDGNLRVLNGSWLRRRPVIGVANTRLELGRPSAGFGDTEFRAEVFGTWPRARAKDVGRRSFGSACHFHLWSGIFIWFMSSEAFQLVTGLSVPVATGARVPGHLWVDEALSADGYRLSGVQHECWRPGERRPYVPTNWYGSSVAPAP